MKKVTRFLFGVADVALAIMLLSGGVTLIRILFTFLDVTFPGSTGGGREFMDGLLAIMGLPGLTTLSYLLLLMAVLLTLGYMLSFFLMLQKQIFGLFMMIGIDLVSFLLWQFDPTVAFFVAVRWILLSPPWLLTWIDLKRRGVFLGP